MPTNSFWSSDDKIPISQTKISIPSENGLSYDAGGRIIFTIPADTVDYFNPINTLLEMDFKYGLPAAFNRTALQLDPQLGGSVLIRHIRIYANSAEMPLLEEIQNANVLASVRYDYDTNDNVKKKRALTEGCGIYDPRSRSEMKNKQRQDTNSINNTYYSPVIDGSEALFGDVANVNEETAQCIRTAKLVLPLHQSGIFGSSVVFPNQLVNGLRLEIILADAKDCFTQNSRVMAHQSAANGLYFHSIDGADAQTGVWNTTVGNVNLSTEFYVGRVNNNISLDHCPFVVGEGISLKDMENPANFTSWRTTGGAVTFPVIKKMELAVAASVGNTYDLIKITLVATAQPLPPSEVAGAVSSLATTSANNPARWLLYSTSLNNYAGVTANDKPPATWEPTYTVSNVRLTVERVDMPPAYTSKMMGAMKQGGTINYDFLSFTNYLYSQMKDDRIANIRIPIMNKRCKGVLCIPCDGTVYPAQQRVNCGNGEEAGGGTTVLTYFTENEGLTVGSLSNTNAGHPNYSQRSGLEGICDGLSNYQFFYDGRLNPSRKVDTRKISNRRSIAQQPLVELEKSLAVCGIPPHSFAKFRENFVVGRAVGIQQGVSDLSTTDFNLQCEFTEATNAPTKTKLWNIYIGHLRRLMIKGDSVMVDV